MFKTGIDPSTMSSFVKPEVRPYNYGGTSDPDSDYGCLAKICQIGIHTG